jgi:hypothetical protein
VATIAEIGAAHELGLGVPRRSFVADYAEETAEENAELMAKLMREVLAGRLTYEMACKKFGVLVEGGMKKRLRDTPADWKELSQRTIDRKKSSKPLIDTTALMAAITHKVTKGGGGG